VIQRKNLRKRTNFLQLIEHQGHTLFFLHSVCCNVLPLYRKLYIKTPDDMGEGSINIQIIL
jgi:hypothetical protein